MTKDVPLNPKLVPELYCTALTATRDFYVAILGFSVAFERPEHGFMYLEREGAEMMFEQTDKSDRTWITGPLEKPFGRGISFQIEVNDVEALYKDVKEKATDNIYLEMEEKWYRCDDQEAGNRQFLVQDPDGYLLRFYQDIGMRPL